MKLHCRLWHGRDEREPTGRGFFYFSPKMKGFSYFGALNSVHVRAVFLVRLLML